MKILFWFLPHFILNVLIILEWKVNGVKIKEQQWQESKQKILFKSKDSEIVFIQSVVLCSIEGILFISSTRCFNICPGNVTRHDQTLLHSVLLLSEYLLNQARRWMRNICCLVPKSSCFPSRFFFFYKPLWPDTEPVKSHTWTLKGFLCVSITSRCEISSDPRKLHLNRDKPWPSLQDWGGLRRLENISGWIVNPPCCFWSPASVHFLRHPRPYDQCLDRSAAGSYNSAGRPMVG